VDVCSALFVVPDTEGAQVWITVLPAFTPTPAFRTEWCVHKVKCSACFVMVEKDLQGPG